MIPVFSSLCCVYHQLSSISQHGYERSQSKPFPLSWAKQSGAVHGQDTMGQRNPLKEFGGRQAIDSPDDNATNLSQLNDSIAPIMKIPPLPIM